MRKNLKKLGFALASAGVIAAPVAALISCSFDKEKVKEGEWVTYNTTAETWERRQFDSSFMEANNYVGNTGAASSFSFFRSYTTGVDHKKIITENGVRKVVWDKTNKRTSHQEIVKGFQFSVDGKKWFSSVENNSEAQKALSGKLDSISFRLAPGHDVYYASSKDGKVVKSNLKLTMRDFFYGWVRSLYTVRSVTGMKQNIVEKVVKDKNGKTKKIHVVDKDHPWIFTDKSTINGKDSGLKPYTEADWKALSEDDQKVINPNDYLYALYHVDIKASVLANKENIKNNKDIFTIKYDQLRAKLKWEQSIVLFKDTSAFTPVPSDYIDSLQKKSKNPNGPVAKYGISAYGKTKHDGNVADTDYQTYSIAPYIYTAYDINVGGKMTLTINKFYSDHDLVTDPRRVQYFSIIQKSPTIDANTYISSRLNGFYNAEITGEYTLDSQVQTSNNTIARVNSKPKYYRYNKPDQITKMNATFQYSPTGAMSELYNEKGRKLVWGYGTEEEILKDEHSDSIDNFYDGNGADLRAAIHSAINWYKTIQSFYNNRSLSFYPGIAQEGSYRTSKFDIDKPGSTYGYPSYVDSLAKMKEMFNTNNGNSEAQYESSKFKEAKQVLNELAAKVGATKSSPAQIPLFEFNITETTPVTEEVKATSQKILEKLNSLTDGKIKFIYQPPISYSQLFKVAFTNVQYYMRIVLYGPDYAGVGSLYQQYIGTYGNMAEIEVMRKAFGLSKTQLLKNNQRKHVGFKDILDYLKEKQKIGLYKNITKESVKKLSMGDIKKIFVGRGPSLLNEEDQETYSDIDALITAYFFDNNSNPDKLKDADTFLLENAFSSFTVGWRKNAADRPDSTEGLRAYQRNDIGFMPQKWASGSYDILHSVYKGYKGK